MRNGIVILAQVSELKKFCGGNAFAEGRPRACVGRCGACIGYLSPGSLLSSCHCRDDLARFNFNVAWCVPPPHSRPNYRLMKPRSFPFFAFGSFFFGYIFDVTKCMYHIKVPNIERPKRTRNSVMTGRPSACTERRAAGVRIGASQSKPILRMLGCVFFQWVIVATVVVRRRMR
jgi:hypothetical protein